MTTGKFAIEYTFKPGCAAVRQRYRDFWQHQTLDSPLLHIKARKDLALRTSSIEQNISRLDLDLNLAWHEEHCCRQIFDYDFLFDSMPTAVVMFGRDITNMGVLSGQSYAIHPETEFITFTRNDNFLFAPTPKFDENDPFVQKVLRIYQGIRTEIGQRACLNPPTTADALSTLAMIMGTENFLRNLCQHPAAVRQKCLELNKLFYSFYDYIYRYLLAWGYGESASWFPVFAEGRFDSVRSDVAVMLSDKMFEELAWPVLADACASVDYAMFNLDALEMCRFLPAMAEIKKLHGVYWNIEPWHSDFSRYVPLLRQIKDFGLLLALPCRDVLDAKQAVSKLGKSGLLLEFPVFADKNQGLAAGEEVTAFARQCLY